MPAYDGPSRPPHEGQAFAEAMGGEIADEMDELADYYEMIEEN